MAGVLSPSSTAFIVILCSLFFYVHLIFCSVSKKSDFSEHLVLSQLLLRQLGIPMTTSPTDDTQKALYSRQLAQVPDYMYQLHKRHETDWHQFSASIGQQSRNLGVVTAVHSHPLIESLATNSTTALLIFNLSSVIHDPNHRNLAAELRLLRISWTLSSKVPHHHQLVHVYDVSFPSKPLLQKHRLDIRGSDWISFDVSSSIDRLRLSGGQLGRYLILVKPEGISSSAQQHQHLRTRRSVGNLEVSSNKNDPHVVTYHRDLSIPPPTPSSPPKPRRRRNRRGRKKKSRRHTKRDIYNFQRHQNRIRKNCRRRPLYVDFEMVGWQNWIIAPNGYDAGYCSGLCPFPLSDNFNATNHAIIQLLVHEIQKESVPAPCCVPLKLSPQSLLYMDPGRQVVLKVYQNMAVDYCACR